MVTLRCFESGRKTCWSIEKDLTSIHHPWVQNLQENQASLTPGKGAWNSQFSRNAGSHNRADLRSHHTMWESQNNLHWVSPALSHSDLSAPSQWGLCPTLLFQGPVSIMLLRPIVFPPFKSRPSPSLPPDLCTHSASQQEHLHRQIYNDCIHLWYIRKYIG